MTAPPGSRGAPAGVDLARCVAAAVAAPSLHNSQPWRFRIRDGGIDVYADWSRRLDAIDPVGRELLISIGAAVFNLRAAVRDAGRVPRLRLSADPTGSDPVARVTPGPVATLPDPTWAAMARAIPRRHTNRRPFARIVVPAPVLAELAAAAAAEQADLRPADPVCRETILGLTGAVERRQRAHGNFRAEPTEWSHPSGVDRRDGLPPYGLLPGEAAAAPPLRDFGLSRPQVRRRGERLGAYPLITVLSTVADEPADWLRAGQALQRVLLLATVNGLVATPLSQPLELPLLRTLITEAAAGRWAQVILRLGYAQPTAPAPRRPVTDVLWNPADLTSG